MAALVLGLLAAVAIEPLVSEGIGRREVAEAATRLRLPPSWIALEEPSVITVERGGVVWSQVYRTTADRSVAVGEFLSAAQDQGWEPTGGSPDLSTVILRRGQLSLALAHVGDRQSEVRVEIARYR